MSKFEYLNGLLGIVLAIALAEILLGFGRLARERERIRFYWVQLVWMVGILYVIIARWWAFWSFRTAQFDDFSMFLIFATRDFLIVVAALLVTPRPPAEGGLDLREYYFRQRRFLCPILAIVIAFGQPIRFILMDEPFLALPSAFRVAGIGGLLWLASTSSPRVHAIATVVLAGLLISFPFIIYGSTPS